jgi:hypothetical protein
MIEEVKERRPNPLDSMMTKAQVVRRKFKSGLPRSPQNKALSKLEALSRTLELFGRFMTEMDAAGLLESDVTADLVYCQPETPGAEPVVTAALPAPQHIGKFCDGIMALDKPRFLGVLFIQTDREAADKPDKHHVLVTCPFLDDADSKLRLLAARRKRQEKGVAN